MNVKKIIFCLLIMFCFVMGVNAEEITLKDVAEKMKTTDIYKFLDSEDDPIILKSNNDSLVITSTSKIDEEVIKFNFADGVISWKFTGDKNNRSEVEETFTYAMWISDIIYSVGLLNDYTEDEIESWVNSENGLNVATFKENGVEIETFDYEFSEDDEYDYSSSGTSPESFKININSFNIEKSNYDEEQEQPSIFANIEILEIGATFVKFNVVVEIEDQMLCHLFRSKSLDDVWNDSLLVKSGDCNTEFLIDQLEPSTTYYFRTLAGYSTEFGDVVQVTTKAENINVDSNNKSEVDSNGNVTYNPETSVNITIFVIIILMLFSVIGIYYFSKKYVNDIV